LRALVRQIHYTISRLPHIGTELPKIWVDIRRELEQISATRPYITESEYLNICSAHGMPERERASFLSDYLHDLGVFLHFRDNAVLKRWIILRPDWGTEAVYRILDDRNVIDSNGYFTKDVLREIWKSSLYIDMHDELISLMMKFELCYKLEDQDT
jgi:internalin A